MADLSSCTIKRSLKRSGSVYSATEGKDVSLYTARIRLIHNSGKEGVGEATEFTTREALNEAMRLAKEALDG